MEFEDLKKTMDEAIAADRGSAPRSAAEIEDLIRARARRFRRGSAKRFGLEIAGVALIYLAVLVYAVVLGRPLASFQVKLLLVSVAAMTVVVLPFARFFALARTERLSLSAREHFRRTIDGQKRSLRIYAWTSYAACFVYAAVFWTDGAFRALSGGWQAATMLYLAAVAAGVRPYLRFLYGRRIAALEGELRRWDA